MLSYDINTLLDVVREPPQLLGVRASAFALFEEVAILLGSNHLTIPPQVSCNLFVVLVVTEKAFRMVSFNLVLTRKIL